MQLRTPGDGLVEPKASNARTLAVSTVNSHCPRSPDQLWVAPDSSLGAQ